MRLMFAAMAAHGHTYPAVPLALAAVRAGHEVVFAAGEQFVPPLRAAGLDAVAAGMGLPDALAAADHDVGRALGAVMARRWADDLGELLAARRSELLVHDVTTVGAALAAARAGVPAVAHTSAGSTPGPTWRTIMAVFAELAGPDVTQGRVLDICPDSLQADRFLATADRVPLRPVGWSPPGAAPSKRGSGPLVYLTLGTAYATDDLLRRCVDGLATLPVDVLVTTGAARLGKVPDNVRAESWVAQGDVLPHVDLVVHHGGSGTMLGALRAGLPQLILPQGTDGFTNAEAVLATGAGTRLGPTDLTSEAVATHAEALFTDAAVRAAHRLAEEIATMPSPDQVIAELTA